MLVEDAVRWLVETVGVAGVPIGIVVTLVVTSIHGKHALDVARTVGMGFRVAVMVVLILAILVATPAIEVDVGAALQLVDVVGDAVRYLAGLPKALAS